MSDVVIRCYSCESKMKARQELLGKVLKCPVCGVYMIIPKTGGDTIEPTPEQMKKIREMAQAKAAGKAGGVPSSGGGASAKAGAAAGGGSAPAQQPAWTGETLALSDVDGPVELVLPSEEHLQPAEHPTKLNPQYRYMVVGSNTLIASWETGKGWQVEAGGKLVSAKRNAEALPKAGDFALVELQIAVEDGEKRLSKMRIFKLARQYSVTKLAGDEKSVLSTITGTCGLMRPQKAALLNGLKTQFMRSVWADAKNLYDFLLNNDAHSCEVDA